MNFPFHSSGAFNITPPPDGQPIPLPDLKPFIRWGVIIAGVIALLVLLNWLRGIFTNLLWFDNLGYSDVFETILVTRIWLFFASALLFAAIAAVNVYLTYRFGQGPPVGPIAEETMRVLRPLVLGGAIIVIAIAALTFGGAVGARWETILAFMNSTPFVGLEDPQFHRGVDFYVFTLPLLHLIQGWFLGAIIVSLLFTAGMYFVHFSLRGAVFTFTPAVRIHLSVLGALLLFVLAWSYWLDVYDLVYSNAGAVFGATYTDVHARLPGLRVLFAIAILSGLILLVNAFLVKGLRLLVAVPVLWLGSLILLQTIIPAVVQGIQVNPNELRRETTYIERNIESTRAAFGLDRISEQDYPLSPDGEMTLSLVAENQETIDNIRLWDHRPFRSLVNQIQFFRLYYTFPNVDVDRYVVEVDGQKRLRQVMLGTRELDSGNLPEEAQSWVNRKLQFTHGYGAVISPVTEFTPEGRPTFFLKDIPPAGIIPLERPEVYYGESREDFVIVNSKQDELNYEPIVGSPIYQAYEGSGGVRLSGLIRRLAYAWEFRDFNVLISGEITSESRIQYHRTVQDRIEVVAPFLRLDADPYIVVSDGKLFWIQDAYTVTDAYPYSTPTITIDGEFNYIRNSVKVVLDVYNGDLDFYIAEPQDPLLLTYQKIFPSLFKPLEEMPSGLRAHIRYPEDLFAIQAEQYLTYHMTDVNQFYNKADQWSAPDELFQDTFQRMDPYYLNMRLPGADEQEFVLLLPFTPKDRENMVGWLAARSDGENYGKLVAFAFPKGFQIDGPAQVEKRISQDFDIKQEFALLCTGEARCIRGNLLVIPMGGTQDDNQILYAEPLYLQAGGLAFPELKRVILVDRTRVVMEPTLAAGIAALTRGSAPSVTPSEEAPPPAARPQPATGSLAEALLREVLNITEAMDALQKQLDQLKDALQGLQDLAKGKVQ